MRYQDSVDIDAPADKVWAILTDVARWPRWTPTMTGVRVLSDEPMRVGLRARIEQPKIRPAVWTVTEVRPGRSFAWTTKTGGVTTVADHIVTERPGGTTVTQILDQTGPMEPVARLFYGRLVKRYLHTEGKGLKRYCES